MLDSQVTILIVVGFLLQLVILLRINQRTKYLIKLANFNAPAEDESSASESKVFVGNIGYSISEQDLEKLFSEFGQVSLVNIPIDKYTGKTRGFGFVTFANNRQASKAVNLNGTEYKGRQLQVNFAREKKGR